MDSRFNAIITKLETPQNKSNLSKFWKTYLIEQKNKLDQSISKCEKVFNENNNHDLDYNTILTMYFLKSNMLNDLNE